MSGYTEEELAGLTDEEREALLEAGDDDTTTTMEESLEGAADDKAGDKENAGDDNQDDAKAKTDDEGKDAGGTGDAGAVDDSDTAASTDASTDAGKPAPLLVAEVPADAEAKLAAISEKKNALMLQVDEGDITIKEYQAELDKLSKEERAIERAVDKANLAKELHQQQEVNNWMGQVQNFTTKDHPEYSTSKVRWMALDAFVKEIGSDPANASMTGAQILAEAHKRVVDDLGEAPTSGKTKAAEEKQQPLKGSKAEAPKTLAAVPAAQMNGTENSKWTSLDRLAESDPLLYEEKLMKLSEAERDEYLARG